MESTSEHSQRTAHPQDYLLDADDGESTVNPSPQSKQSPMPYVLRRLVTFITCVACTVVGFHILVILLIGVGFTLASVPNTPIIRLAFLSSSAFGISDTVLSSAWAASIKIQNPNGHVSFQFAHAEAPLSYKRTLISTGAVKPFHLAASGEGAIAPSFLNPTEVELDAGVIEDMEEERRRGVISFSLAVALQGTMEVFWWFHKPIVLNGLCMDLNITFRGPRGVGNLEKSKNCLVLL